MKQLNSLRRLNISALIITLIIFTFCSSPTESETSDNNDSELDKILMGIELEDLSPKEIEGLKFMREEEKLARDVYSVLYDKWDQQIFSNISNSEQRHMNAIKMLLNRYNLQDPVINEDIGVFSNESLQNLYSILVDKGKLTLLDGLKVGATIEEIDILDLENQIDNIIDNKDINLVYNNLLRGSRNHLRAFVRNISSQGEEYKPQYLPQEKFDEIINSDMESGKQTRRKGKGDN